MPPDGTTQRQGNSRHPDHPEVLRLAPHDSGNEPRQLMNTSEFTALLSAMGDKPVRFILSDGGRIPDHAHVTEVGRVDRE